ncbi:hypothetical protein HMPREF2532_02247 [Bacteroides ovatus]|nr:hypothetical protein HMPREF2532_02247 [Bacteroides ovatus]
MSLFWLYIILLSESKKGMHHMDASPFYINTIMSIYRFIKM